MHNALVSCAALQDVRWLDWSAGSLVDEVAMFRVALSEGAKWMPPLRRLLSPDELARAARYRQPADQLRFGSTRGVLRLLLGHCTQQQPDRLEFVAGVNQKPELKQSGGWHFNVSHSGDWLLIALGRVRVGVDLEEVNPKFPFHDVLEIGFSPDEQRYIDACADARFCFYELWTRKEALVKATAQGMTEALDRVPSLPGLHPTDGQLIGQDGRWAVRSFTVAGGYPAAVAYEETLSIAPALYDLNLARLLSRY